MIIGCICSFFISFSAAGMSRGTLATSGVDFLLGFSLPNGIKYINLLFISLIKLTPFRPSASLVAILNKTGLRFLIVALAAINTGVSVIALAIRLMELPVKGAIIIKSSGNFGPRGS